MVSEIFKDGQTNRPLTDRHGWLYRPPSDNPGSKIIKIIPAGKPKPMGPKPADGYALPKGNGAKWTKHLTHKHYNDKSRHQWAFSLRFIKIFLKIVQI